MDRTVVDVSIHPRGDQMLGVKRSWRDVRLGLFSTTSAALIGASAVGFVAVEPAWAEPTNCTTGWGAHSTQAWARCDSGTGQYRAEVKCDATWPTSNYWKYGAWYAAGSGFPSYVTCSNGDDAMEVHVARRWLNP